MRIRYGSEVTSISGSSGDFQVQFRKGQPIRAKKIILALGVQGNPRKLGVPGDSLPVVTNTLESADAHRNETIVSSGRATAPSKMRSRCRARTVWSS